MSELPIGFPHLSHADDSRPALMDDSAAGWVSYGELKSLIRARAEHFAGPKSLVFLFASNDVSTVASLYGAWMAGHAVALINPELGPSVRDELIALYRPQWLIDGNVQTSRTEAAGAPSPHPDVALLLSTSGSTGSPKFVRLTLSNTWSNATAIAEVLSLSDEDCAAGHLPLHYSFGLSVLTSHLAIGARIRLTQLGFTDRLFWQAMRDAQISHLPGVPFHFQMMQKLGYRRLNLSSLTSLTQAGGFLDVEARHQAHAFMESTGGRFYVMYGQTEAAPRMTTLQHAAFPSAPASVGTALPGCTLAIIDADETGQGEVEFRGPNVMMGYAECAADLARGDEVGGRLLTGDIGRLDDNGLLTLTGRSKRFGKVFGLRVNLDEIEAFANSIAKSAVTQRNDGVQLHVVGGVDLSKDEGVKVALLAALKNRYALPASSYALRFVPEIPHTDRGKVDYRRLESQ